MKQLLLKYFLTFLATIFVFHNSFAVHTWTGTNGSNWFDSGNWDQGTVPSNGDEVVINSGFASTNNGSPSISGLTINSGGTLSVTLNSTLSLGGSCIVNGGGSLQANGGIILLNSDLDIDGNLTLASGTLQGGGDLTITGTMDVSGGNNTIENTGQFMNSGTINFAGTGFLLTTLINSGSVNVTSTFQIGLNGHILNLSTIDIQNDAGINEVSGNFLGIMNQGTIMKSGGSGTSQLNLRLFNNATVEATSGQLELSGSGLHGGDFMSNGTGYISFEGTDTMVGGNILGGSGAAIIDDGTVFLQGNVDATNFTIDQGQIYGSGDLAVSGAFNFYRGTLGHFNLTFGEFYANGTLTLGGPSNGNPITYTRLVSEVSAVQTRTLVIQDNGEFFNNGSLDIQNDANLAGGSGSIQIRNNGTITKSGTNGGYSEFGTTFINYGTVNIQVGELRLTDGGVNGGLINISAGAVLNHTGSNNLFTNYAEGQIAGQGEFEADANVVNNGGIIPGSSPGILTFNTGFNNLSMSDSTVFEMEIGGTTLGAEHDHLVLGGTVSIDGLLDIHLINGFVPALNDNFVLIDYTNLSGWFSKGINACTGVDTLGFEIIDNGTEIIATVVSVTPPALQNTTICSGDSVMVYGIFQTQAGIYYDSLQTAYSCDSVLSTMVNVNTVDASITQNTSTLTANTAGAVYQWIDCDAGNAPITGATNQDYMVTETGDYAVVVTENGCSDTSACANVTITGIEQALDETSDLFLYPNPADDHISIMMNSDLGKTQISLFNSVGEEVRVISNWNTTGVELSLAGLPKGIYLINAVDDNSTETLRFIKQ